MMMKIPQNKMNENIFSYSKSYARNKIVLCRDELTEVNFLDIGSKFSTKLKPLISDSKLAIKSTIILDDLLSNSIKRDETYGKYLAIKNLGILFEPELKTDFTQILDKYSSSNTLFVKWEGEIEDGILYFLTKEKGQKIDIKNLSHIVI